MPILHHADETPPSDPAVRPLETASTTTEIAACEDCGWSEAQDPSGIGVRVTAAREHAEAHDHSTYVRRTQTVTFSTYAGRVS